MTRKTCLILIVLLLSAISTSCKETSAPSSSYDPQELSFSGKRAFAIEDEFVTTFTNRHSGTDQSLLATEWLWEQFTAAGWTCEMDDWEIINYSQPVPLRNVVCRLPGEDPNDPREILVLAHHDQASTTIQGADNDGSGIAILLHLAEIFASESPPKYTLVFVADDAEEYGMVGSRRYIQTHPDTENIIAGLSLDNLGRYYYDSMILESVGQFSGYGPIWIALTTREAARAAGNLWEVKLKAPFDQALGQAVPISLTDQGPMVAAGVPALGFGAGYQSDYADEHYRLWHDPDDNMENQTPEALEQSGLISEAWIRQLLSMETFPEESGPYLYFDEDQQVLRGAPLYPIFIGFVGLFFVGSYFIGTRTFQKKKSGWLKALPHYLGLWLPLVASILLLYLFVEVGIMDKYHLYPATTKDPAMLNPRWSAVILFLLGLGLFFWLRRRLVRKYAGAVSEFGGIKSLAFLFIGLVGVYIVIANPFSLMFLVPVLLWFLIRGRKGFGKMLDIFLFLLGGLMVYALIYFFGFLLLRYGFVFLWMFMNIISIRMFSFPAMLAATAVMAAGLSMIVSPPASK
jgi:hypothetical protein